MSELRARLKNVHVFTTTPFRADDLSKLDLDGFSRNLRFLVDRGVQVINVGGGTAEVEALSNEELLSLTQVAFDVVGSRSLLLPTLPGNFKSAVDLAPRYQAMGAQVLLAMPPYLRNLIPPDLEGVARYLEAVAEATELPLIPYNTQGWPPEFFARLSRIERIVAIKDPMQQPHNFLMAIRLLGDRFVWIGNKRNDPPVLHYRYMAGIEGFTAGNANFAPEFELELHRAALRQDWSRMIEIQLQLAVLERLRNKYGDAVIKTGLDLAGLAGGRVRPPRLDLTPQVRAEVRAELVKLGVEVKGA